VQGRSAIETGLVMLPIAFGLVIGSGVSHKLNLKLGTTRQLVAALILVAVTIGSVALWQPDTPVWIIALFFFLVPLGMGNVMAPGTEAVMSAVPEDKAGVGSAMNDLNRQVAGALGVAIIGSVSSSVYSSKVEPATAGLSHGAASSATDSVGGAMGVAAHLSGGAGDALAAAAQSAFTDAIGLALLVGSGVALAGAALVKRYLREPAAAEGLTEPPIPLTGTRRSARMARSSRGGPPPASMAASRSSCTSSDGASRA
jgi:DHA2 family multidrug resistance protein-like MFS transporter